MTLKTKVILDQPLTTARDEPLRAGQTLDDDDFLQAEATANGPAEVLRPKRRHRLWWSAVSLILILLLVHSGLSLWQTWQDSQWLGAAWSLALALLALAAGSSLWREARQLRRLERVSTQRARAEQLLANAGHGQARGFCEQLARGSGLEHSDAFAQWQTGLTGDEQDGEVLSLYSRQVLATQDRQARAQVLKWSGEAAVMVAASPLAAVDMLLVLWRNLKMMEDITRCYGIRLGAVSRLRLLKSVLHHMLYVGVSEAAIDAGMDLLGLELAGRLSARAGQGVGAGLLTARLGLQTMDLCRPVPWQGDEKKQLGGIRRALIDRVAALLSRREHKETQ
ncbi:TIGR01620 family protein [Oceanimonas sp. CHS3-5]|uniref:YcjF family protein n=1 Tax=Oceanimonas sp. CHS3-5 TaxID=3068186 RepID=UPI00273F2C49|nr:TIGR01620 family protein [Oceanimonas sp. CHS3-5]MDP5291577.1 TIGR01620 family protein [Oceanimonas sp. CHS3-5]